MKGHSIGGTTMTAAEKIYELVKALPEAEVGKVLVFVEALEKKVEPQTVNPSSRLTRTGTLASLRGIAKRDGPPPTDEALNDEYTDYLIQKYQ
jgi:Protein of unknown function (DUF2281)